MSPPLLLMDVHKGTARRLATKSVHDKRDQRHAEAVSKWKVCNARIWVGQG